LVDYTGAIPNQTALIGLSVAAWGNFTLLDINDMKNFYCIDRVNAAASVLEVSYWF